MPRTPGSSFLLNDIDDLDVNLDSLVADFPEFLDFDNLELSELSGLESDDKAQPLHVPINDPTTKQPLTNCQDFDLDGLDKPMTEIEGAQPIEKCNDLGLGPSFDQPLVETESTGNQDESSIDLGDFSGGHRLDNLNPNQWMNDQLNPSHVDGVISTSDQNAQSLVSVRSPRPTRSTPTAVTAVAAGMLHVIAAVNAVLAFNDGEEIKEPKDSQHDNGDDKAIRNDPAFRLHGTPAISDEPAKSTHDEPTDCPLTLDEEKKIAKKEKNRESAKRSRDRAKKERRELVERNGLLKTTQDGLKADVDNLESICERLEKMRGMFSHAIPSCKYPLTERGANIHKPPVEAPSLGKTTLLLGQPKGQVVPWPKPVVDKEQQASLSPTKKFKIDCGNFGCKDVSNHPQAFQQPCDNTFSDFSPQFRDVMEMLLRPRLMNQGSSELAMNPATNPCLTLKHQSDAESVIASDNVVMETVAPSATFFKSADSARASTSESFSSKITAYKNNFTKPERSPNHASNQSATEDMGDIILKSIQSKKQNTSTENTENPWVTSPFGDNEKMSLE